MLSQEDFNNNSVFAVQKCAECADSAIDVKSIYSATEEEISSSRISPVKCSLAQKSGAL